MIANKAREWAGNYSPHSDGQNTFVLFAEWVESLPQSDPAAQRPSKPICCYCDNTLSCAHCGMEQPDDSTQRPADCGAWQPIDTAPRDGTAVILGFWYQGRFAQYQGFYNAIHAEWMENSRSFFPRHMQRWFALWTHPPAPPPAPAVTSTNRLCPNGLEHGNCGFPDCVSSCPGRISDTPSPPHRPGEAQ